MSEDSNNANTGDGAPPAVSERELIEAAAAAAPQGKSTTTQRAMDVVAAADIQREAITRDFNQKKAQVSLAVEQQKAMALHEASAAKQSFTMQGRSGISADAQQASENLSRMAQAASTPPPQAQAASHSETKADTGHETVPEPVTPDPTVPETGENPMPTPNTPVDTAGHAAPTSTATQYQNPHYTVPEHTPGTILPKTVTGQENIQAGHPTAPSQPAPAPEVAAQPAPPPQPAAAPTIPPTQPTMPHTAAPIADAPIAQEIALTIRMIISQEIEKQLQALLTAYTAADNSDGTTNKLQ